jgi:hypothetical protein
VLTRRSQGHLPQVTFTSDFHALVSGDLIPGPFVVRYDPHRIVPPGEIEWLSATQRPVAAHVRFLPAGGEWAGELRFAPAPRLTVIADQTGQGTMLEIEFTLPEGCEELECWFSYVDNSGATHWDSAGGANHWLRFPAHDLNIRRVELRPQVGEALDRLEVEVESVPAVESVQLRWRYTQPAGLGRQGRALESSAGADGHKRWSVPDGIPVASDTIVVFDLVYTVGAHKFTDDNEGTWYLVSAS